MSTIIQRPSIPAIAWPTPKQRWAIAATCPLLISPIWLGWLADWLGPLQGFNGLLLSLLLISSAYTDLTQRKIFNWATYTAFVWALAINLVPGSLAPPLGAVGLTNSLLGGIVCFLVMLIPYSLARGGAGDVKLATAIGALVGMDSGLLVIAFAYIVSAISILGWTIWVGGPLKLLSALFRRATAKFLPQYFLPPSRQQNQLLDQPIPLAGFFLVATLLVVFDVPAILRSL